jgi:hypothetical protein
MHNHLHIRCTWKKVCISNEELKLTVAADTQQHKKDTASPPRLQSCLEKTDTVAGHKVRCNTKTRQMELAQPPPASKHSLRSSVFVVGEDDHAEHVPLYKDDEAEQTESNTKHNRTLKPNKAKRKDIYGNPRWDRAKARE